MNSPTGQSQVSARANVDALLAEVSRGEEALAAFMPEGTSLTRFMALARRAILEQPGLLECNSNSVLRALREAALSGLELDGKLSTLIVRRRKHGPPVAAFDLTYRGMISLALESGIVRSVEAQVVRTADTFRVELGTEQRLVHVPLITGARGDVCAVYCVVEMTEGGRMIELLTSEDIARIRAMSPAGDRGPWGTWDDEMSKKAVMRRALKRLPGGSRRVAPMRSAAMPAATLPAPSWASQLMPEEVFALECRWLEQLSAAATVAELDATWQAARIEHQQRGADVPNSVHARWAELREMMVAAN